jgi:hypothetical protein
MRLLPFTALFLAATSVQAINLYKCEVDGQTTFSDRPCHLVAAPDAEPQFNVDAESAARALQTVSRLPSVRHAPSGEHRVTQANGR